MASKAPTRKRGRAIDDDDLELPNPLMDLLYILREERNVSAISSMCKSALVHPATKSMCDTVITFLMCSRSISTPCLPGHKFPLQYAIEKGDIHAVRSLLKAGASPFGFEVASTDLVIRELLEQYTDPNLFFSPIEIPETPPNTLLPLEGAQPHEAEFLPEFLPESQGRGKPIEMMRTKGF